MYLPSKKHFKAQMLSNGTYNFSEVVSSSDSNKSWILGGQDSCHVSKFQILQQTCLFGNLNVPFQNNRVIQEGHCGFIWELNKTPREHFLLELSAEETVVPISINQEFTQLSKTFCLGYMQTLIGIDFHEYCFGQ